MISTKEVKTDRCKSLIIIFLINLHLNLINEAPITCQSISSKNNSFMYTSM